MVVSASRLPTEFAPAERALQNEIVNQAAAFGRHTITVQLLDSIPDAFLILDQHRQAVFANQTLLDVLGVASLDDVLGLRPGELLGCVHASKMPGGCGTTEFCRTCGAVAAILNGLNGKCDVQECRITQKDGTALDLRVWSTPFQFEQTQYTIFAVKDISDEKRRRALERVFFHDVLNTATIISGYIQLLEANPEDAEMVASEMTHIVERLVSEINTQRDLTAAENGELDVHSSMIDPLIFLQEIQHQYERHPVSVDKHIVINTQQTGVVLYSDRILLERVIGNMVKNALEASSPGETVTLSFSVEKDDIMFTVHNRAYMPRDVQLQVFQRSFSTKGMGRGLGAYSMKLLSERYLNGHVDFVTAPKHGTTFQAVYPLIPANFP